jgi:hypothetical protein
MRDVIVPRSFPEARVRRLLFIVFYAVIFLAAAGWLVSGLLNHWSTGAIVVFPAAVLVLRGGVAFGLSIYCRG